MSINFKGEPRRVLITGVTGTLGRAVCQHLLDNGGEYIQILGISRDEQKQRTMPQDPRLILRLADVRDYRSLYDAAHVMWPDEPMPAFAFDYIFHFAALKCVDTLEDNPTEAVRTNVTGTHNVCKLATETLARVIFTSTDKAAFPINSYGMSKALAERIVLGANRFNTVCRYGNVIGSRGSIVDSLRRTLTTNRTAFITHPKMTRFWMTADDAKAFVLNCAYNEHYGLQYPHWIRSSFVVDFIRATADALGITLYDLKTTGVRPGEKFHECMANEFETSERGIYSNDEARLMNKDELLELVKKGLKALK
jgi:UDP-N-acetylglucosamine 4,6-dehydratase/5-epimerase